MTMSRQLLSISKDGDSANSLGQPAQTLSHPHSEKSVS